MTPVVVPRATYSRKPEDRELYLHGYAWRAGEALSTPKSDVRHLG
jgi:hypothetical protein